MPHPRVLQLFSRYLQYGGEEGSVYRIGDAMQEYFDVEYLIAQSADLLQGSKATLPFRTYRNRPMLRRLRTYQQVGCFDFWLIHNVFPAISPGAYSLAAELEVPIIHYLHNYRMGCVNGYLFTENKHCTKCIGGAFWHGALGACWRDSIPQSAMMGLLLADTRRQGLFKQVRRWIAISEAQKRIHVAIGLPEERIEVITHFLDHDPSEIPTPIPANGYALFVGRLSQEKGVDRLVRAWADVPAGRKLVIAGDGPELENLQKLAGTLKLENISFAGFVPKPMHAALWQNASFLVIPSVWQEPFGMVVLEAWAKGRTVVAHAVGAMPELIDEGRNGFLANPETPGALAKAINLAFSSHAELARMGKLGHQDLLEKHNRSIWLKKMKILYENAIG